VAGDEPFESFYAATHDRLVASLAVLLGDVSAASDAADEAFERALTRWERVAAMTSPAGWTYRVALNVARRSGRRRQMEQRLWARQPVSAGLPDAVVEIRAMLESLAPRQRAAMTLRVLGDLTQDEIASVLGVARTTVQSALADGAQRLAALEAEQKEMEADADAPGPS